MLVAQAELDYFSFQLKLDYEEMDKMVLYQKPLLDIREKSEFFFSIIAVHLIISLSKSYSQLHKSVSIRFHNFSSSYNSVAYGFVNRLYLLVDCSDLANHFRKPF